MSDDNGTPWTIFSYGSNSITQLRARVENDSLTATPAKVNGFSRVFCLWSPNWGSGGVASICPCPGSTVYGACVRLSGLEKKRLDQYEGSYRLEEVEVALKDDTSTTKAYAYIAGRNVDTGYTLPMEAPPSEEYLTAIHVMLREQWNMENKTISICSYNPKDNTVSKIDEYEHPSSVLQLSLEALCVEINTLKATPWKMPLAIKENVAILSSVIPRNGEEEKESKRLYGHQLLPHYESLEQVLDQDTYQALQKIMVSKK